MYINKYKKKIKKCNSFLKVKLTFQKKFRILLKKVRIQRYKFKSKYSNI